MAIVSTFTFSSDTETVTRTKLNNLVANLLTEFNGNIDNNNIDASAAIAASKLNLATISQNVTFTGTLDFSGATLTAQTTFADLIATTIDINGGTIDGVAIGASSAGAITCTTLNTGGKLTAGANEIEGSNFDINGGTINGATIGDDNTGNPILKGWIQYNQNSGTANDAGSFNVSSITDGATGIVTINWDIDFATAAYGTSCTAANEGTEGFNAAPSVGGKAAGSVVIHVRRTYDNALADVDDISVCAYGDQ